MNIEEVCHHVMTSKEVIVPKNAAFIGGSTDDFLSVGCAVFRELVHSTQLNPDSRVLDIGCGLGRVAYPLAYYLKNGRYVGLEVVKDSVEFCQKNIAPIAAPNVDFEFIHTDIHNTFYNSSAKDDLINYNFPDLGEFDVVFMSSVCTHLINEDLLHYFKLVQKWTRSGGDFLATWFLIDNLAKEQLLNPINSVTLNFDLTSEGPDYFLKGQNKSTAAVAYDIDYVLALYEAHSFKISSSYLGPWSGVKRHIGAYQDLIVARKN
jgi:SAM-dependent methyltransferase